MGRSKVQRVAVPAINIAKLGVADADGILEHRVEDRLQIAWRAGNNLEHFRGGRLLLQRLRKIGGALAEVVSTLPQLVEQPRVLDGNDGLSGEVLH